MRSMRSRRPDASASCDVAIRCFCLFGLRLRDWEVRDEQLGGGPAHGTDPCHRGQVALDASSSGASLYDELRPGKPRSTSDERVAELIQKALHTKPANGATHWSVRAIGAETGISPRRARPSAAAPPSASVNSCARSIASCRITISPVDLSSGPPPPIPSSKTCIDFAHDTTERHTQPRVSKNLGKRDILSHESS